MRLATETGAVIANATERDLLFPASTRALHQRVFHLDDKKTRRWDGTNWVVDPIDYSDIANAPGVDSSFANNTITTAGLTYGYNAGTAVPAGVITRIATGTVVLADESVNYVERTYAGVVSANQTRFNTDHIPMALVTTTGGAIASIVDYRTPASAIVPYPVLTGEINVVDVRYPADDARRYGVIGDGVAVTDMTLLQNATKSRYATGGGDLFLPAGTYLATSAQLQGTNKVFVYPRSSVRIVGEPGRTIIKAANGLNTTAANRGYNFIRHNVADEGIARVDDFGVEGVTFDHNGTNNLIPATSTSKDNVAVGVAVGSNLRIERCVFKNNAGLQTLSFGNNSAVQSCSNVFINDNLFLEMGGSVSGNIHSVDHSSVYLQSVGGSVSHNTLVNSGAQFNNSALELHCTDLVVDGNTIINYQHALNIAATVSDHKRVTYSNNVGHGIGVAAMFFQVGAFRIDAVVLEGNVLEQVANYITPGFVDFDSQAATTITFVRLVDNTFTSAIAAGTSNTTPGCVIGRIKRLELEGNTWRNFSGRAVQLGTIDTTMRLTLDHETVTDCGTSSDVTVRAGLAFNSLTTIAYLRVARCTVENVAATYMTDGIVGNAPLTKGEILDNTVSGVTNEVTWNVDQSPLIRHIGTGNPAGLAVRAQPGSLWQRKDPIANQLLFMKTGTGSATGWIAAIFQGDAPSFLQTSLDVVGALSVQAVGAETQVAYCTDDSGFTLAIGRRVAGVFTRAITFFDNASALLVRFASAAIQLNGSAGTTIRTGSGVPNGSIVGSIGDIYLNKTGGASTSFYVKESGTATNTGWIAK